MNCFDGVTYSSFLPTGGRFCQPLPSVGDGAFCAPADQSLRRGTACMASPSIVPKGTSERKLRASARQRSIGILKKSREFSKI
jgi:hypothetical protein